MASDPRSSPQARLSRLSGFLEHDPDNLNLIADAAQTAYQAGDLQAAERLLARSAAIAPLTPAMLNLQGMVAMEERRFEDAARIFQQLLDGAPEAPALRYNLAFARMMLKDYANANDLLDEAVVEEAPAGALLKVQALHQLGELEDALAFGTRWAAQHPDDVAVASALAVLAFDADEPDLARDYAQRAGETHEGLSTLGMLALKADDVDEALDLFDKALSARPDSARAFLGKGLALMTKGDLQAAIPHIDRAAAVFERHLGSWVASGWAHFAQGDRRGARAAFETALDLDPAFAETQGGLAVLDFVDGRLDSARRRTEIALRLDRKCLSGALAKSLLLENAGEAEAAQRVRALALQSIGRDGQTLAAAMSGLATTRKLH